jgi:hypothetical protein
LRHLPPSRWSARDQSPSEMESSCRVWLLILIHFIFNSPTHQNIIIEHFLDRKKTRKKV